MRTGGGWLLAVILFSVPAAPARADFIPLGFLPGGGMPSDATGVSADGSVVVGSSKYAAGTNSFHAFRWTAAGGMVGLGFLPGGGLSLARGVSADGSVVVGDSDSASGTEAVIWDGAHGMRSLRDVLIAQGDDLTGWTLSVAVDISADGRTIVGWGANPSGQTEAWLARLEAPAAVPAPPALVLAGLGALALGGYARRRRGE
jgi:probable HAF family extracellular repeat protein